MRQIKELLVLVRNTFRTTETLYSICATIEYLFTIQKINQEEYDTLKNFIRENIPLTFNVLLIRIKRFTFFEYTNCYWWEKGKVEPRIKWLNKHIKKLGGEKSPYNFHI